MNQQQENSILEMAKGAFLERADYEMVKIMDNIQDPNTKATGKRTMTITLEFVPDEERERIGVKMVVKSKLEPTNAISTGLFLTSDEYGKPAAVEMVPQIPGQQSLSGTEQESPKVLRLIKKA